MANDRNQPAKSKAPAEHDDVAVAPPCAMVIFGAAGDLTKRLLVPALYNLVKAKRLSSAFQLVGIDSRSQEHRGMAQALDRDDERVCRRQNPAISTRLPGAG